MRRKNPEEVERLRELERAVRRGDPGARTRLQVERSRRSGVPMLPAGVGRKSLRTARRLDRESVGPRAQPRWRVIENLGDVNPIEHGGFFVYRDLTGRYPEEAEIWEPPESDESRARGYVYRLILERCTYVDEILSDNEFHPDFPAWFASDVDQAASSVGLDRDELVRSLCSADPIDRAFAYRELVALHGPFNFDEDPLRLTTEEARRRYGADVEYLRLLSEQRQRRRRRSR